jgi:hypothetical protein
MHDISVPDQIKNHSIAIVSLIIAITALTYNTWREEETEKNRTTRLAAFEVLKNLGQLQAVVNYAHFDHQNEMGNPINGWGYIALISDLSEILPEPIPQNIHQLTEKWSENYQTLQTNETSTTEISEQIDVSRESILNVLHQLR